jgi:hypothetical protein
MRKELLLTVAVAGLLLAYLKFDRLMVWWHSGSTTPQSQTAQTAQPTLKPATNANPSTASASPGSSGGPSAANVAAWTAALTNSQGASAPSAAAPAPAPKAPPGYLYVLRHISKKTDTGVIGIDPGTLLALISRGPVKSQLTDGSTDFEIENRSLTDDSSLAEMASSADAQTQAQLAALLAQRDAADLRAKRESTEKVENAERALAAQHVVPADIGPANIAAASQPAATPKPAFSPMGTSLDRGAYNQRRSVPWWWW